MKRANVRPLLLIVLLFLLVGCGAAGLSPQPAPTHPIATLFPTTASHATTAVEPTLVPDETGWQTGSSGIELRHLRIAATAENPAATVIVVRLDPARVRLRVGFAPTQPRSLDRWFADEHPLAVINGGFFTQENQPTALLISNGEIYGSSYNGFGGMLGVNTDGSVTLQALRDQPYEPNSAFSEAIQSFPMLVFSGGNAAEIEDDNRRARRTAVALDRSGRLLLLVSPTSSFSLRSFGEWLSQSDLDIDCALNFDGGSSTGLYLRDGTLHEQIDAFSPLPIVLLVDKRE